AHGQGRQGERHVPPRHQPGSGGHPRSALAGPDPEDGGLEPAAVPVPLRRPHDPRPARRSRPGETAGADPRPGPDGRPACPRAGLSRRPNDNRETTMRNKSVVTEAKEINLAVELVQLGARLQVLEAATNLSRERLLKLYKEVKGESPPKGMLPFSTDWFMSWQ